MNDPTAEYVDMRELAWSQRRRAYRLYFVLQTIGTANMLLQAFCDSQGFLVACAGVWIMLPVPILAERRYHSTCSRALEALNAPWRRG